jgi:hypothetical protein
LQRSQEPVTLGYLSSRGLSGFLRPWRSKYLYKIASPKNASRDDTV